MPSGTNGVVVEVRVFNRHGIEKDERAISIERAEIESVQNDKNAEEEILESNIKARVKSTLVSAKLDEDFKSLKKGTILSEDNLSELSANELFKLLIEDKKIQSNLAILKEQFVKAKKDIQTRFEDQVDKIQKGDDLLPGVMKMVKVFVAMKRKLQAGDKMAGRHGNKGVISRIVPVEDMPYMNDGRPVDIVLNPLGVPSRMNVGQILETHLGWACSEMGEKIKKLIEGVQRNSSKKEELKNYLGKIYKG